MAQRIARDVGDALFAGVVGNCVPPAAAALKGCRRPGGLPDQPLPDVCQSLSCAAARPLTVQLFLLPRPCLSGWSV